jgi:hypothetical protein
MSLSKHDRVLLHDIWWEDRHKNNGPGQYTDYDTWYDYNYPLYNELSTHELIDECLVCLHNEKNIDHELILEVKFMRLRTCGLNVPAMLMNYNVFKIQR